MSAISLEHFKSALKSLSSTIFKNIEKTNSAAEQAQATADDAVSSVRNLNENKMDKSNPSGTGYFVMNPLTGQGYGEFSSSLGRGTAAGRYSHAEGQSTAYGSNTHAEGNFTTARGVASHAEGTHTEATSTGSHAEGGYAKAESSYAHAEGYTTQATGQAAHAEGISTQANSKGAHAEGLHTRAYVNNPGTHAQGRANIPDADGKYAHIVGNGKITNLDNTGVTSVETYSNAHTVDWDGNAWYAGNVYVGGTGQDDENASKLISEKQVGKGLKMDGDTLNVDEGVYELIEIFTLEEDAAIERTQEPDGTPYNFKKIIVKAYTTAQNADSGSVFYQFNGKTVGKTWWGAITNNTGTRKRTDIIEPMGGYWISKFVEWNSQIAGMPTINVKDMFMTFKVEQYPAINRFYTAVAQKTGTTIEIWAVRA